MSISAKKAIDKATEFKEEHGDLALVALAADALEWEDQVEGVCQCDTDPDESDVCNACLFEIIWDEDQEDEDRAASLATITRRLKLLEETKEQIQKEIEAQNNLKKGKN